MSRIIRPANVVIFLLATLLIGCGVLMAGYVLLPAYLESRLVPEMAADLGMNEFSLQVRRVGLFGAELEQIRLGPEAAPEIVVDDVRIDYSPSGLLHKRVRQVVIRGVELGCEYRGGRLVMGENLQALIDALPAANDETDTSQPSAPPFERLTVRRSAAHLQTGGMHLSVPFELDVLPDWSSGRQWMLNAVLRPRGQRLEAVVKSDLESGRTAIRITADALQLNAFADLAEAVAGLQPGGTLKIDAAADIASAPLAIVAAEAAVKWSGNGIRYHNMHIEPAAPASADGPGWRLRARTAGGGRWHVSADPFLVSSDIILRIGALAAGIEPSPAGYEIAGQLEAEPLGFNTGSVPADSLNLTEKPLVSGVFNAAIDPGARWEFTLTGKPVRPELRLETETGSLSARLGAFRLSARAEAGRLSGECTAGANSLTLRSGALTVSAAALELKAKAPPRGEPADEGDIEMSLALSNAGGRAGDIELRGVSAGFDGTLRFRQAPGARIHGTARFSAQEVTAAGGSARVQNAGVKVPLSWPPADDAATRAGFFNLAKVRFKNWTLSKVKGAIGQTAGGFSFSGRHRDAVVAGLSLDFNGRGQLVGQKVPVVDFSLAATRPESAAPIDLGTLLPGGKGMVYSGGVKARFDLRVVGSAVAGSSALQLTDGRLQAEKGSFDVSGIQLGIEIPALTTLRSAPGQQLSFSDASLGDIRLKNGLIVFQIEPAPAVLLERGLFDWGQGRVDMLSSRIFLDREDYSLTLFCDRLNLAALLEQFGVADAEGEGTVSGKIPIRYQKGKWSVDRGFLYSSPGEGGKIRLEGTDILTAGIPTGSTQYVQMEIAREALKNYNFSWAKLSISTEGEDMLLKLQLDGKPATTLPFEFRKELGAFARVDGQARGSKFQGIRLDVNFRLPLNKILEYKSIIQLIRNKGVK